MHENAFRKMTYHRSIMYGPTKDGEVFGATWHAFLDLGSQFIPGEMLPVKDVWRGGP